PDPGRQKPNRQSPHQLRQERLFPRWSADARIENYRHRTSSILSQLQIPPDTSRNTSCSVSHLVAFCFVPTINAMQAFYPQLTPEQRQAIAASGGLPVQLEDPDT